MKLSHLFVCSFLAGMGLFSCKNDTKNTDATDNVQMADTLVVRNVEESKEEQKAIANSVLAKLMTTPETLSFTRYLISANLTDLISKNEGPYTVIAPSNEAFEKLSKQALDSLVTQNGVEKLSTLLKSHIVEGDFSSASLLQSVKKTGEYKLNTLGGTTLTFFMEGSDIMLKDDAGAVGKMGKSDIMSNNGQVHVIDAVLGNF
ncbi:MAG: fasciclin domain-containing protein [Bacteroidota bacterium]